MVYSFSVRLLSRMANAAIDRHQPAIELELTPSAGALIVLVGIRQDGSQHPISILVERTIGKGQPPQRRVSYSEADMINRLGGPSYPAYSTRPELRKETDPLNWQGGISVEDFPFFVVVHGCKTPQENYYWGGCIIHYLIKIYLDRIGSIQK